MITILKALFSIATNTRWKKISPTHPCFILRKNQKRRKRPMKRGRSGLEFEKLWKKDNPFFSLKHIQLPTWNTSWHKTICLGQQWQTINFQWFDNAHHHFWRAWQILLHVHNINPRTVSHINSLEPTLNFSLCQIFCLKLAWTKTIILLGMWREWILLPYALCVLALIGDAQALESP